MCIVIVEQLFNDGFKISGRGIILLKMISETLNFKINYTFVGPFGFFLANGIAGPLKFLLDGKADLSISNWWLKIARLSFLEATTSFYSDQIVFVIPPEKEFTAFEKLIFPFHYSFWIGISICFIIEFAVIFIIKRQRKVVQDFVFGENVKNPHFNMFISFIGGSQKILPKNNFARFLLMMLLIYSLVIRSAYQGSYFKLMQSDEKHKEVQSIEEMIEKDITIYATLLNVDNFKHSQRIMKRYFKIFDQLIFNLNFFLLFDQNRNSFFAAARQISNSNFKWFSIQRCYSSIICFSATKNF
jgi:hypothetical protein